MMPTTRSRRRARSLTLRKPLTSRDSFMSARRCSRRIRRAPMCHPLVLSIVFWEKVNCSKRSTYWIVGATSLRFAHAFWSMRWDSLSLFLETRVRKAESPSTVRHGDDVRAAIEIAVAAYDAHGGGHLVLELLPGSGGH